MGIEQSIYAIKQADAARAEYPGEHLDASSEAGSKQYWAPCLAVALVAASLFYVTLKDLVHESAARAPALAPAVMPAYVEAITPAAGNRVSPDAVADSAMPAVSIPSHAPLANTSFEAPVIVPVELPAKAAPAVVEVHKCVMPDGDAAYSDGPCPEGARASTLRLPRGLHASASL